MARVDDPSEMSSGLSTHSDLAHVSGGLGSTLAPILETDDITIEPGEQQQSGHDGVLAQPPNVKRGTETEEPDAYGNEVKVQRGSATSRRPSLAATIVESATKQLAIPRIDWREVVDAASNAICSIGQSRAKTPPETIRAMHFRSRINFYLSQPEESRLGWVLHHVLLCILLVDVALMAAETLDGPRFGGVKPGYPYLPGDLFFQATESGLTVVYILEFILRWSTAPSQKFFWSSKMTWMEVIACTPDLVYQGMAVMNKDDPTFDSISVRASLVFLRLARIIRIIGAMRVYDGTKIMFRATMASVAPLKITLFFLITVVMVFATAIFYAEPCYDLKTCTYTDIFNAGYFVMVTVATVGYGSQVPSLLNGGSLFLTCVVMIFGSLYLAMPLAIVGIRYDSAWREYEKTKREESKSKEFQTTADLLAHAAASAAAAATGSSRSNSMKRAKTFAKIVADETLEPLETRKVYSLGFQICDRFYDIAGKVAEIKELIASVFEDASARVNSTHGARASVAAKTSSFTEDKAEQLQIQRMKTRNETTVKALEQIVAMLKVHKKVCSEIRALLPAVELAKITPTNQRSSSAGLSMISRREGSFSKAATGVFGRARRAFSVVGRTRSERFEHVGPPTWRSKVWDVLEHNDESRRAKILNKVRLYIVVLSIVLFYAQTTPELQATGYKTLLCRRSLSDFCKTSSPGFSDQPGCFVLDANGVASTTRLHFDCPFDSTDPSCYAAGYNYGSDHFASTCARVFGRKGTQRICNNRLCKPPVVLWADMEPKWAYFEFFFGFLFTFELLLRVVVHPSPKKVYRDLVFIIDAIALFPFYVEISEFIAGKSPTYSIVPTAPSFFAIVRVFKTFRVLKLGTHISGSEVLARTAYLVYRRLMIPVFFLFIGCIMCGAIFYELERGTECFIGKECIWWDKEILTPAIARNLPVGKRIMVQNTKPSQITDMLRSSWFSIVTMTTVGYGDIIPRTALGRFFDILAMVMSVCYTAMPLTLVGGQFYVCYEMHLITKRRKKAQHAAVEPKGNMQSASNAVQLNESDKDQDHRKPVLLSLAGLSEEPMIPGLNSPLHTSPPGSPGRITTAPLLVGRRDVAPPVDPQEPTRPAISSVEMQTLTQFVLMFKVLNHVIEDLSQLNRLGSQRVATKKDRADEIASLQQQEAKIQHTISDNMAFCANVLLGFAPVIEKILGLQDPRAVRAQGPTAEMPSILHAAVDPEPDRK